MDLSLLQLVVNEQHEYYKTRDTGIHRNIEFKDYIETSRIVIISGIRRCGKSTLMLQMAKNFPDFHYVTFDDERLINFIVDDFQDLITILHKRSASKVLFFDEIQNIPLWERFVRRIHDQGYKLFLTGSNANLLSSELATHLTGRYLKIELFPFSFFEIIRSKNIDYKNITTQKKALILSIFDQYIENGGFPEWYNSQNKELLQRIYEDIIYRDVIARYKIQEIKSLKQLSQFLMTNLAKEFSYQSIAKTIQIKSTSSVKNYVEFLESVYLLFEIFKYDYSLKKQYVSNKKIYTIDMGLRNVVSFKHSSDLGRLLENLVFLELKRRQKTIFFHKEKHECDFIIEEKGKIIEVIQVCLSLNEENQTREFAGLIEAAHLFNLNNAKIINYNRDEILKVESTEIHIIPVWKWLLELS
jgi:uncharacterized protein